MAEWGKVYQLKKDVAAADVWGCIVRLLQKLPEQGVSFPQGSPPRHFFWQDDSILCRWTEDDAWASFDFAGTAGGAKTTLQIIFSKKEKSLGKEAFHLLSFYEKTGGGRPFCLDFFGLIKERKLIPKKQTQCQVKRIEYLGERLKGGSGSLKVVFSDNRGGSLLEQAAGIAERLWFLCAEFYTCDELDFMRIWEDGDPKIKKLKEDLSPKLKRQMDSKDRRAQIMDRFPEFEPFKQMLSPAITAICNDRDKKLPLDETKSGPDFVPVPHLIDLAFELTMENFREERKREFKDLLDRHTGKDIFDIQGKAEEQAMNQFLASQSLRQLENQREVGKTDSSAPVLEQDAAASPAEDKEKQESRIAELEKRAGALGGQNAKLEAEIGRLEEEKADLETENRELQQRMEALQEQLNTKNAARTKRQNEERRGIVRLEIPCGEDNLFPDEIEDWLYALLYWAVEQERKNLPEDKKSEVSRKRDVIDKLVTGKEFDWDKSETNRRLASAKKTFKDSPDPSDEKLGELGLKRVEAKKGAHPHLSFFQERYQIPYSKSPRDQGKGCTSDNKLTEIKWRFFLTPPSP